MEVTVSRELWTSATKNMKYDNNIIVQMVNEFIRALQNTWCCLEKNLNNIMKVFAVASSLSPHTERQDCNYLGTPNDPNHDMKRFVKLGIDA